VTLRTPGRSVRRRRSGQPSNRLPGRPFARLIATSTVAVIVPVALTGCAAGQRAQTANEYSVVDGASADVGSMGVRNAGITAPTIAAGYVKGASATLSMTVINNGKSADTLVSVTTPSAARATLVAPTPTAANSTAAAAATGITVPADGAVIVGSGSGAGKVTLTNLTTRLVPGQIVPVTMNFRVAGQVIVQLPVKLVPGQTGGQTVDVAPPTDSGI
jgi:copper(I)-binding protein